MAILLEKSHMQARQDTGAALSPRVLRLLDTLRLKKARALMMFLLLSDSRKHRSEKIYELLWRGADVQKASSSYRQTVRHIRVSAKDIPELTLTTGSGQVSVALTDNWNLIDELAAFLTGRDSFGAGQEYVRSFLGQLDLSLGISDSFDSWIEVVRARALARFQRALEDAFKGNTSRDALRAAEFLLEIEPHNELAARFIMTRHWRDNAATRAIDVYNRLYEYLDTEFDQEPETETIELLAAISNDPQGGSSAGDAAPRSDKVTLSVQLKEQQFVDSRGASFQTVLLSDLRMRLSRFREWRVVDDYSSASDFLLIRLQLLPIGQSYRLSVEVSHPPHRDLIWSELIDEPENNWDEKARALVFNVANALRIVVADRQGSDIRAYQYDKWLQSLALIGTWEDEDDVEAIELLSSLTAEAPNFSPAHAELAGIYNIRHIIRPGTFQTDDIKDLALFHALEAVSLDPTDTRAHRVLAWCYCHKSEFDLAEFHFDQAMMLNPQNPHSLSSSALGFAFTDNLERARELNELAERLPNTMEPFHLIYFAATNYLLGDYDLALEQCEKGRGLMSTVGGWHSATLAKLGRMDEAQSRLTDYQLEIAQSWYGAQPATMENVLAWFTSVFPLRNTKVRDDLQQTLKSCCKP